LGESVRDEAAIGLCSFAQGDGNMESRNSVIQVLEQSQIQLLAEWVKMLKLGAKKHNGISDPELQSECEEFIGSLRNSAKEGASLDISTLEWADMREFLTKLSRSRNRQGFSPSETASFVFSFKGPLFNHLRLVYAGTDETRLFENVLELSNLIDRLGLYTMETYQSVREEIILKQREEMLELSTPVIQLWDGVLALPIIGTLDSSRTQVVMEALLQQIVTTRSPIAILDITGVPTVDTLTAQHLLKTVAAARLMGAECIISGIRPQIAQTIVHLGVDLGDVQTKASLADAFRVALKRLGHSIQKARELS
jgi:rsbT co-antagonist protein RsbR